MAKSILVSVEPTILKYARKKSGYTLEEVSKKSKIVLEKLLLYEEEKTDIPISQIEKFANIYKRPLAMFLLSKESEPISITI